MPLLLVEGLDSFGLSVLVTSVFFFTSLLSLFSVPPPLTCFWSFFVSLLSLLTLLSASSSLSSSTFLAFFLVVFFIGETSASAPGLSLVGDSSDDFGLKNVCAFYEFFKTC